MEVEVEVEEGHGGPLVTCGEHSAAVIDQMRGFSLSSFNFHSSSWMYFLFVSDYYYYYYYFVLFCFVDCFISTLPSCWRIYFQT